MERPSATSNNEITKNLVEEYEAGLRSWLYLVSIIGLCVRYPSIMLPQAPIGEFKRSMAALIMLRRSQPRPGRSVVTPSHLFCRRS